MRVDGWRVARALLFVALTTALAVAALSWFRSGQAWTARGASLDLEAVFNQIAAGLTVGAPVRLKKLTVGQVTSLALAGPPERLRVLVGLRIEPEFARAVTRACVASISTEAVFGKVYVELLPSERPAPSAAPGAVLTGQDPPDPARWAAEMDRLLGGLHALVDETRATEKAVRDALPPQTAEDLRRTLTRLQELSRLADDPDVRRSAEGLAKAGRALNEAIEAGEKAGKSISEAFNRLLGKDKR